MVTTGSVTVTFGYDAAGALAVKTVRGITTTHYIGGIYERTLNGVTRRYYRLGDQLVLYDGTAYHYLYSDQLNSAVLTTNPGGTKTSETRYYPYGAHRYDWGSDPSDRDFTGQRRDAEIALLDYVARRYSPYLGRFVSPDPIVPQAGRPVDLNRYAYVRNNPLWYTDPSGYDPLDQAWRDEFRAVHGRDPTAEDMQIRLFSIAFPDEWDWGAFYTSDGALRPGAMAGLFQHYPARRDWAGMPSATGRLAGWYTSTETEAFVRDIGSLFAGLLTRHEEANGWRAVTTGWVRDFVWVGRNSLPDELLGTDWTGNVHHWAWSLNLGYFRGEAIGRAINEGRELRDSGWNPHTYATNPNHRADVALGNIGVAMGAYMSNGILPSRAPQALQSAWGRMPLTVRVP